MTNFIRNSIILALGTLVLSSTPAWTQDCQKPMADASFNALVSAINGRSFSSDKMKVARQGAQCMDVKQVETIMQLFSFEDQKLEFAKFAYPKTVDKENYFMLNSVFSFSSSTDELDNFMTREKAKEENKPKPEPVVVQTKPEPQNPQVTPRPKRAEVQPRPKVPNNIPVTEEQMSTQILQDAQTHIADIFDMMTGPKPRRNTQTNAPAAKPPRIVITSPDLREAKDLTAEVNEKKTRVAGLLSSSVGIYEVFVNAEEAILNANGTFFADIPLFEGVNNVRVSVTDLNKNNSNFTFKIDRKGTTEIQQPQVDPSPTLQPVVVAPITSLPANFISDIDKNVPKAAIQNSNAIAVVIGNKDYTNTKPVDYALNDARSMRNYLKETFGFKEGNILYKENATLGDFNTFFGTKGNPKGRLANTIKINVSDVFIFFSGHGAPGLKDNKGYFVPVEANPNYIEQGGYSIDLFYENLSKIQAKSITVVTDACFSGADIFSQISPMVIKPKLPENSANKTLTVLSSSSGTEVSSWYPEQIHGLFTYFFLKAIQNPNESDLNKDKKITLEEVYKYVSDINEGVPYYARRIHGVNQTPTLQGAQKNRVLVQYK